MNYRRTTVKKDTSPYLIYYPCPCNELPPIGENISDSGCQTVSIDIGIKNFAIRIETRYRNGYIKLIYFNKIDFTQYGNTAKGTGTAKINPHILMVTIMYLESLLPILRNSNIIGIERQPPIDSKSTRMFQHVLTFFMLHAPTFNQLCIVMDIYTGLKGKMLDAPPNLNHNGLKIWAIQKARELLSWRNDDASLKIIDQHQGRSKTKADDLADTVVQMEAWFILVGGIVTQKSQTLTLN